MCQDLSVRKNTERSQILTWDLWCSPFSSVSSNSRPWRYLQMKVIGCAIRKMGAAKCPIEIRFQDTHVCNCLLMWMSSKSGSQLLCVPCSLKYLMYLRTLQETFKQCWVSGPHHLDLLPLNALEKLVFIFLNRGSHLQMVLIALHLLGRTKLIRMRKKKVVE